MYELNDNFFKFPGGYLFAMVREKTAEFKKNNPDAEVISLGIGDVPGLAFALDSHVRLGFGGGYYDRFLAKYNPKTVSLVSSPMQFASSEWPVEKTDIPIQTIVTTNKIY